MRRLLTVGLPIAFLLATVLTASAATPETVLAAPSPSDTGPLVAPQPSSTDQPVRDLVDATRSSSGAGTDPGSPAPIRAGAGGLGGADLLASPLVRGVLAVAGVAGLLTAALFLGGARIVDPDEVLRNDTRRAIFEHLKREVGANLKEITETLELTTTNAIWHLRKLEEANLVCSRRFNGYKIFYPAEGGVAARRLSVSMTALANDNARAVFEYIVANPGAHQRQIARALEVNHGTVRWHLKKLQKAELLTEVRQGKATTYFSTDMGRTALTAVDSDEPPTLDAVSALPV